MKQETKRPGGATAVALNANPGGALVPRDPCMRGKRTPAEKAAVLVDGYAAIEHAIQVAPVDTGALFDVGDRGVGDI